METHRHLLAFIMSGLWLGADAESTPAGEFQTPYHRIIVRNVFDLTERPKPIHVESRDPPPPTIKVVGITTILTRKCAILKWPAAPGGASQSRSYVMTEGQRVDEIEVLQIDEHAGTVRLNNHGVVQIVGIAE